MGKADTSIGMTIVCLNPNTEPQPAGQIRRVEGAILLPGPGGQARLHPVRGEAHLPQPAVPHPVSRQHPYLHPHSHPHPHHHPCLHPLPRNDKTDPLILKQTKDAVRVSICHTATVIANGSKQLIIVIITVTMGALLTLPQG